MKIATNSVVSFHYILSEDGGDELENSSDGEPTVYLHGHDGIIKGLEAQLSGKIAGDSFTASLAPEDAYGPKAPDRAKRVPVKHLIFKGKLRPGMTVQLNTSEGRHPVTVIKTGRHSADVDTNHPLAGKTLRFDISVVDVREATAEEISHRHAHGPGGHQH